MRRVIFALSLLVFGCDQPPELGPTCAEVYAEIVEQCSEFVDDADAGYECAGVSLDERGVHDDPETRAGWRWVWCDLDGGRDGCEAAIDLCGG